VKHLIKAQLAATKPAFVTFRPNDSIVGIVPHPPISFMLELGSGPSDGGNLVQFLTEDFDSTAWQKALFQHFFLRTCSLTRIFFSINHYACKKA
jgi:hypothetical protein